MFNLRKQIRLERELKADWWIAIDSKSEKGKSYLVTLFIVNEDTENEKMVWRCDCKAFRFNKYCSHIEEAKKVFYAGVQS